MKRKHTDISDSVPSIEGIKVNCRILRSWLDPVKQPSEEMYEGHGVAKKSVFFVVGDVDFSTGIEEILNDRGGPGNWMWKHIPKPPPTVKKSVTAVSSSKLTKEEQAAKKAKKDMIIIEKRIKQQQQLVEIARKKAEYELKKSHK